jgi:hypothetical protein
VQLRFATSLTSAQYVSQQAWRDASLDRCPAHPEGGCGFKRNGTYERAEPPGARVSRWYCELAHTTFSFATELEDGSAYAVDGAFQSWTKGADQAVYALAVSGTTVFAGGAFSMVGGQERSGIALLDATTGNRIE